MPKKWKNKQEQLDYWRAYRLTHRIAIRKYNREYMAKRRAKGRVKKSS